MVLLKLQLKMLKSVLKF